ncbi:MAG: histidinol-phosphate transaminase [Armatimonadetes bacterium]|nr:histidinol-phosphate transaminase [Armatimonadota bacterium]
MRGIVKPQVMCLRPYSPGMPVAELERLHGIKNAIKLASNENPFGPAPAVVEAIRAAVPDIGFYPDGAAHDLRHALAARHGVSPDQLCIGNGSDELIQLLGIACLDAGDELVIGDPTFARYEPQATLNRAVAVKVPLRDYVHDVDAMADAVTPRSKMIIVANPANPAGTYVGDAAIERFLDRVPESVLVVLDEAYYEFVDDPDHGRSEALCLVRPNVVILRTFSKIHALAALRIGYSLANRTVTDWLEKVREPFNTGTLAHVAARKALQDETHVRRTLEANRAGRIVYAEACARLGVKAVPSQANFVLMDLGRPEQPVYQALLQKGVIVRACTPLGLPNHIRVTVGTPEQCERFVTAFAEVLAP